MNLDFLLTAAEVEARRKPEDLTKPARGTKLLEHRKRSAESKAFEKSVMREAKVRDGWQCRFPNCEFRAKELPIDVCHERHRGIGGNPTGDRTDRRYLISYCRIHHGMYDRHEIDHEHLAPLKGADGPCAFYRRIESGRMECVAVERMIGMPEMRGA